MIDSDLFVSFEEDLTPHLPIGKSGPSSNKPTANKWHQRRQNNLNKRNQKREQYQQKDNKNKQQQNGLQRRVRDPQQGNMQTKHSQREQLSLPKGDIASSSNHETTQKPTTTSHQQRSNQTLQKGRSQSTLNTKQNNNHAAFPHKRSGASVGGASIGAEGFQKDKNLKLKARKLEAFDVDQQKIGSQGSSKRVQQTFSNGQQNTKQAQSAGQSTPQALPLPPAKQENLGKQLKTHSNKDGLHPQVGALASLPLPPTPKQQQKVEKRKPSIAPADTQRTPQCPSRSNKGADKSTYVQQSEQRQGGMGVDKPVAVDSGGGSQGDGVRGSFGEAAGGVLGKDALDDIFEALAVNRKKDMDFLKQDSTNVSAYNILMNIGAVRPDVRAKQLAQQKRELHEARYQDRQQIKELMMEEEGGADGVGSREGKGKVGEDEEGDQPAPRAPKPWSRDRLSKKEAQKLSKEIGGGLQHSTALYPGLQVVPAPEADATNNYRDSHAASSDIDLQDPLVVPESGVYGVLLPNKSTLTSFKACGVCNELAGKLEELKFMLPTPIQSTAIPILLQGYDALLRAPTGSGKTLAYVVPMINKLQAITPRPTRESGAFSVCIVPTRELCQQTFDILQPLLRRFVWLVPGMLVGGHNRTHEKRRVRKGLNVVIATPGRLLDHMQQTSCFNLNKVQFLIMDEADRLLDLGFEKQILQIIDVLNKAQGAGVHRQCVLLSATLQAKVCRLADLVLYKPVPVGFRCVVRNNNMVLSEIVSDKQQGGLQFELPAQLLQQYAVVDSKQRLAALTSLLRGISASGQQSSESSTPSSTSSTKAVVFVSTAAQVDFLHALYTTKPGPNATRLLPWATDGLLDIKIVKLHGNMEHQLRKDTFREYQNASSCILLCTDVAARGLDFPTVSTIIQYDPSGEPEEYVHRVGRTARLGRVGRSVILLRDTECGYVALLDGLGVSLSEMLGPDLWKGLPGDKTKPLKQRISDMSFMLMQYLQQDGMQSLAIQAYQSFIRAYAAYPRAVSHVLHYKSLNLGHVAHSFGIKAKPSEIGRGRGKSDGGSEGDDRRKGSKNSGKRPPQFQGSGGQFKRFKK